MATYSLEEIAAEGGKKTYSLQEISGNSHPNKKTQQDDKGILQNAGLGALRGATNIGTTLLTPVDWAYDKVTGSKGTHDWRKQQINDFYNENANTDSFAYKGGELASEIAGTAGAGGVLANGVRAVPALTRAAPKLASALETGGFKLGGAGATTAKEMAGNVATRLAGGAVTGGASAGMVNPDDAMTGAGIGAVLPVVGKAAYDVGKGVKAGLIDPLVNQDMLVRRMIANSVGENAMPDVLAKLSSQAATPGVRFSAGQATQNSSLAAMEDALKTINPGGSLNAQDAVNRRSLSGSMRDLAQSPEARLGAVNERDDAANALYGRAFSADSMRRDLSSEITSQRAMGMGGGIHQVAGKVANQVAEDLATPGIRELANRPGFATAVQQAKTMAANKGARLGDPLQSLEGLHYIKLALDDMANPNAASAMGRNATSAVMGMRDKLADELATIAPLYGNARTTFADMSKPINQMDIGQYLSEKLIPATAGDIPATLNASRLATALQHPDKAAQLATRFKGAKLESMLTPEQLAMVRGVSQDASQIAEATKLGMGNGSPTARRQSISNFIGDNLNNRAPMTSAILGGLGNVPILKYGANLLGEAGNMVGSKLNARMAGKLEEALASNPKEIERALLEAKRNQIRGLLSEQYLNPAMRSAIIQGGLLSAQ